MTDTTRTLYEEDYQVVIATKQWELLGGAPVMMKREEHLPEGIRTYLVYNTETGVIEREGNNMQAILEYMNLMVQGYDRAKAELAGVELIPSGGRR